MDRKLWQAATMAICITLSSSGAERALSTNIRALESSQVPNTTNRCTTGSVSKVPKSFSALSSITYKPKRRLPERPSRQTRGRMATEAQIAANQANAKLSCGPTTSEGKAASSKNHIIHGLTYRGGMFVLLPWESAQEFKDLVMDLKCEYTPKNRTEMILVERMAQHHWLRNRATLLQGNCFLDDGTIDRSEEHTS